MKPTKLFPICVVFLAVTAPLCAQQTDANNKPSVVVGNNRPKNAKDSPYRIISGTVKDQSDNPVSGAIVQLKDTKSARVIDFATKDDGKFTFRDLAMDVNYELLAKRGDLASPVKKVSPYDTRKQVTINFQLEPPAKKQ